MLPLAMWIPTKEILADIKMKYATVVPASHMGKGLLGPSGGSSGLIEGRLGERCGGNGGRGGSMSGVGEGKVDSIGGMRGGLLAICSMVSNDSRGGRGLVIEGGIGVGGGEVNGGGVDLGVSKILEVVGEMIGESGGIEVGEVPRHSPLEVREVDKVVTMFEDC
ncbi:hypothetical protein Tco_0091367 [Tanacetum coccineum]